MTYVYIATVIGVVGLIALAVFALHLFRVVRRFGQEVNRVSEQLGSATSKLQQAAATAPSRQHPPRMQNGQASPNQLGPEP